MRVLCFNTQNWKHFPYNESNELKCSCKRIEPCSTQLSFRLSRSTLQFHFKMQFCMLRQSYQKCTFRSKLSHLVIHSVRRVLIWRPLHDSRLALVTFQRQGSLVGTKGCEFVCRRLIWVRFPVAEPPSSGGVHVTTTVLPRSGKNPNSLQNRCHVYIRVNWQKELMMVCCSRDVQLLDIFHRLVFG